MSDTPNPSPDYRPRCIHLTCKSMMVFGEAFQEDPEYQAGQVEFTCLCTFKGEGPDGGLASLEECSNPERSCYCEY
jgi:hypothetical protein